MNRLNNNQIPTALVEALSVLQPLLDAGYDAYIVGGAVRDTLLYNDISDVDIATSATPAEVVSIFEKTIPTGLQHGTVTVIVDRLSYEVTTFRTESVYKNHRRPETVQFVRHLLEDLQRRDFTMNAMALNDQFYCIDPFNGIADLKAGVLRCVGEGEIRFQEDALRMLRAIRFLTTYKLMPTLSLWRALHRKKELIGHVAMERISSELEKIVTSQYVSRGLILIGRSQLLLAAKNKLYFAPALSNRDYHSWQSLSQLDDADIRWVLLFIECRLDDEQIRSDMEQLRFSKKRIDKITQLITLHKHLINAKDITIGIWLDALERYGVVICEKWLHELAPLTKLHVHVVELHRSLHIHSINKLKIKGSDLIKWTSLPGGPWVQLMLSELFKVVALGQVINEKDQIKKYVKNKEGGITDEY